MKKINLNDMITYLLIIVIMFLPKINLITVPGSITGIRIEDFLILIFCVNYFLINKRIKSDIVTQVTKRFYIHFFVCIISLLFGILFFKIKIIIGFLFLIRKIEYFIFIFVGYKYYKGKKSDKRFKQLIGFSIVYHFIIIILQSKGIMGSYRLGGVQENISGDRLCSIFNGAYEFSAYLLLFLVYYIKQMQVNRYNIIFILMILIEIYLSQSRSSIVIGLLLIIIYWIENKKVDKKKILQFVLIMPIIIVFISIIPNLYKYLPRFDNLNIKNMIYTSQVAWENKDINRFINEGSYQLVSGVKVDYSFNIRISKVMTLIDGFFKYPILGCGIGVIRGPADCNYARILVESGLIGFITFFYLIYYLYKLSKRNESDYSIIIRYGILSLCLGSIFIDLFEASKIMMLFWLIVGGEIKRIDIEDEKI